MQKKTTKATTKTKPPALITLSYTLTGEEHAVLQAAMSQVQRTTGITDPALQLVVLFQIVTKVQRQTARPTKFRTARPAPRRLARRAA